jgi:hypothetical protein
MKGIFMQITEVSVSMTKSLPGYNNISSGLKATIGPDDEPRIVEDSLFRECNEILTREIDRRNEADKKKCDLANAVALCRQNGLVVEQDEPEY